MTIGELTASSRRGLRSHWRPPGWLVRRRCARQRGRQCLHVRACPRVRATSRQAQPRPGVRLLDRARDRDHGRLKLVRRSQLGPRAQACGRLHDDRSAGDARHHALVRAFDARVAQVSRERRRPHAGGNRIPEWHRAPKTGDSSFFGLGVPTFWAEGGFTPEELQATANATCGWWHHSLESTFDKIDWDWMADHIRIYGAYLWELCTAPVLPFEFVSVADQFEARIARVGSSWKLGRRGQSGRACRSLRNRRAATRRESPRSGTIDIAPTPRTTTPPARPPQHLHQAAEPRAPADRQHRQRDLRPRHVFVHAAVDRHPLPI